MRIAVRNLLCATGALLALGSRGAECPVERVEVKGLEAPWTVATRMWSEREGVGTLEVRAQAEQTSVLPSFEISFLVPQIGIRNLWSPFEERYALPCGPHSLWSGYGWGVPVRCLFGDDDANRLTMALSDPVGSYDFQAYDMDHDGTNPCIHVTIKCATGGCAPMSDWSLRILLDWRNVPFGDAVRASVGRIEQASGIVQGPVPESAFKPVYSTWYAFTQGVTAEAVERDAAIAARLGMRTVILDDGWQRAYGDWRPDPVKFPDLKAHVSKVKALGMKYLLWYAVPFIDPEKAPAHARFDGTYLRKDGEIGILDPRRPESLEFIASILESLLRDYGVDGFKLDFINRFSQDHRTEVDIAAARMMETVVGRLRKIRPDVLIEFRQFYCGPAVRALGNMVRALDCPGDRKANRMRIANLRLTSGAAAVHADMLEWHPKESAEDAANAILNVIFSVVQYSMILDRLPKSHLEAVRHWLAFAARHESALLHGEFRPRLPDAGYPILEGEDADERILAVYLPGLSVDVGRPDRDVYVLNATPEDRLTLRLPEGIRSIEVFDTFGTRIETRDDCCPGTAIVRVPKSGFAICRHVEGESARTAEGDPPCVMLRFSSAQTRSPDEWKETAKAFAENPGCCDEVWFSTGESFPGLDWHRRNAECVHAAAEDLRRLGIGISLQFEATIGHGDAFPTAEEKRVFDKPWIGWTGADGSECRYCNCPRQPGFLRRLAETSEIYATIRPSVVWIDDDLRIENPSPVTGKDGPGCWCATCVGEFAREDGRPLTRESLHAAWKSDGGVRVRWLDFSVRSMANVARVIARAFRKISPDTRMGLQAADDRCPLVRGVIRALAEETGGKASLRMGGGRYYDLSPYEQISKSRQMAVGRRQLDIESLVDNWYTEVESYPRAYGSRSVRSIALEAFSSLGWGFDTVSLFVMDRRSETDEFYSRFLLKPLVLVTRFLNDYRSDSRGTVPAGFCCPISADDDRPLMGLPILPGFGTCWGTVSAVRERFSSIGAVWGEYRGDLMTDFRKTPSVRLQSIRDRVSGSAPMKLCSPFIGVVLPRVTSAGEIRTIGLIGTRLDPQEDIVLLVDTDATSVVWKELGASPKCLEVRKSNDRSCVTVPSLGA